MCTENNQTYYLRHAPHWSDVAPAFSQPLMALKWPLITWLEASVGPTGLRTEITDTGASVKVLDQTGEEISKFKLQPYDTDSRCLPVSIRGEGILLGLDEESCERVFPPNPREHFPDLPWVTPFSVTGGIPRRYWWANLAVDQAWPARREVLGQLSRIIRRLESGG